MKQSLTLLACMVGLSLILTPKNGCFATKTDWLFENSNLKCGNSESNSIGSGLVEVNVNESEKEAKINEFRKYIAEFYKKSFNGESISQQIKDVAEELYLKLKKFVEQNDNDYDDCFKSFDDKINKFLFNNESVKIIKFENNFNKLDNITKLNASFKNYEPFSKFLANDFSGTKFETPFGHGIYATDDEETALNFAMINHSNDSINQKDSSNYTSYEKNEKPFNGIVTIAFDPKTSKIINYKNLQKIRLAMLFLHPDMFKAYEIFYGRYGFDAKNCDFSKFYSKEEKLKSAAFRKVFNTTLEGAMAAIDPDHELNDAEYKKECCKLMVKAFKNQNFVEEFNRALKNNLNYETYTNHTFAAFNNIGLLTKLLEADAAVLERETLGRKIREYNFVNPEVLIINGNEQNKDNNQMIRKIIDDKCENNQKKIDSLFDSISNSKEKKQTFENKPKNKNDNLSVLIENLTKRSENKPENTDELGEMLQTRFKNKQNILTDVINSINNKGIKHERSLNQILQNIENRRTSSSYNTYDKYFNKKRGNKFEVFPSHSYKSYDSLGLSKYLKSF